MAYGGFGRDHMTLKYRCPARHYGYACEGQDSCPVGKAVRIPLETDRRVFTPLARSSLKWERCYDKRTAVERVNSRLDTSFGFEKHTIRGLMKMDTRCCIALVVMLAMAVGRIKANQAEKMRSLVQAARAAPHNRRRVDDRGGGLSLGQRTSPRQLNMGHNRGSTSTFGAKFHLLPDCTIGGACLAAGINGTILRRNRPQRKSLAIDAYKAIGHNRNKTEV